MADNIGFDDGMSDAERHFFSSGGDVNDDLAREHSLPAGGPLGGQPEPPAAPVEPVAPNGAQPPTATPPAHEEDPGDELVPGQAQPRRVSFRKYQAEQEARANLEKQLQERAVNQARIEERLNLLQQALQPDVTAAQPDPADERPDPTQDIFAYTAWQERQLNKLVDKVTTYEQQIETGQKEMNEERQYVNSLNAHAASDPHFMQSYNFLLRSRAAELMTSRYPNATYEQLMQAQIPDDIGQILVQEERDLYKNAFAEKRNPAADIVLKAQLRGWRAPTPAAPQPANGAAAPAPQPAGTPLAAAPAVAPRPGNGVPPQPSNGATPTATDLVESIRRGQAAATSLSNGSGSAANQLTPQVLADMPEEQFNAIYNELMASGDKTKLRELFGS
jgi:DNA-binding transcriptional MerR regulator